MKSREEYNSLLRDLDALCHNKRPLFPFRIDLKAEEDFVLTNDMLYTLIQKIYLCMRYHRECRFDMDVSGHRLNDEAGLLLLKMMSTTFTVNSMNVEGNNFSRDMLARIDSYKAHLDSRRELPPTTEIPATVETSEKTSSTPSRAILRI